MTTQIRARTRAARGRSGISLMRAAPAALLLAVVATSGCMPDEVRKEDRVWLLPPAPSAPESSVESREIAASIAVLGSAMATLPANLPAGPTGPGGALGLPELLAGVERTYPLLDVAEQELAIAEGKRLAASGAFDLKLKADGLWQVEGFYENHSFKSGVEQATGLYGATVFGGWRIGRGDFDPTFDGKRLTNYGGEFGGGVRLPLLRGGLIDEDRSAIYSSEIEQDLAAAELRARRIDFAQTAAAAYWKWVAAGQTLGIVENLLKLAEDRQRFVEGNVRGGMLPEITLIDNERLVVKRRALAVKARRKFEQASFKLSLFLRDAEGRPVIPGRERLPDVLPEPVQPRLALISRDLELALRSRPEPQLLNLARDRYRIEARLRKNQRLPTLDVAVMATQDQDQRHPSKTKGPFELHLGLEFAFPVQQRKARGKLAAARAKLRRLEAKASFVSDKIRAQVRDALSELQADYERVGQARRAAVLARRLAIAEERKFELGKKKVTIIVLNIRETSAAEAEIMAIEIVADYWMAVAEYRAAIGADF